MSEITTTQTAELILAPMTRTEAETAVKQYHDNAKQRRVMLYQMYQRKAHEALRYEDFGAFATEILHVENENYAYQQIRWVRVETLLLSVDASTLSNLLSTSLPYKVALPLSVLLDYPDILKEAFAQYMAIAKSGLSHPATFARQLKEIVASLSPKEPKPAIEAAPSRKPDFFELPATVEKPTLKPTFTPEPQAEPEEEIELELPDVGETKEAIDTASATLTLEALKTLDKVHLVWMIRILRDYCEWAETSE